MPTSHKVSAVFPRALTQWSLPRGRILHRALRAHPVQEYLLYLPSTGVAGASVLVAVHGISRNAIEQANAFAELCEKRGSVLVVPVFNAELHDDYQRLGRLGRGVRADLALNRCLDEVAVLTGADVTQFRLFGFSGGAQFAHRYLMVHPHRVSHAVIVAAGWYTHPDPGERYPYGIRNNRRMPNVNINPEELLQVPIHVLVGAMDTGTNKLRRTQRVNAQQGETRLERAHSWVDAMRTAAVKYGMEPRVTLSEVDGVDHSVSAFSGRGRLQSRVDEIFVQDAGDIVPRAHAVTLDVPSDDSGHVER